MSVSKDRSVETCSGLDGPINADEMMRLLLEACPSFEPKWQQFLEEWDESYRPFYLALCALARHMIDVLQEQDTATIQRLFDAVELLVTRGDGYVSEAITVGLLEDLQNGGFYEAERITVDREDFRQFTGPEAEKFWDKSYLFWEGEIPKLRG